MSPEADPAARAGKTADPGRPGEGSAGAPRLPEGAGGDAASARASAPGSPGGLVLASALVVALALAAGLRPDQYWLVGLLVVAAMSQGLLAGVAWRGFWRGPAREALFGAGGRYAGFLLAVAFSAVEAYAVGAGIGREDAPGPVVAIMLAPPLVVAAVALRSAVRHRRERDRDPGGAEEAGEAARPDGAAATGSGPGTPTTERSEERGP
jgi:hypothetical protein